MNLISSTFSMIRYKSSKFLAMFSQQNPKAVAIIGGAEGATLREVLKHSTVEKVTMIEIDRQLMDLVKEYLPEMSDCSNLAGRAANCFQDELLGLLLSRCLDLVLECSELVRAQDTPLLLEGRLLGELPGGALILELFVIQ